MIKKPYTVEGVAYSFAEVRAEVNRRFPETSKRIGDILLRKRLGNTTKWEKLGQCPLEVQRNVRNKFKTIIHGSMTK